MSMKHKKILVFGGTAEGRDISVFLGKNNINVTVAVATEYGGDVLPQMSQITLLKGRLSKEEIFDTIKNFDIIIDATHPFAQNVSCFIKEGMKKGELIRILRPESELKDMLVFASLQEVCEFLNKTTGNVLATTGSKELAPYTQINDYENRVFVRALPTLETVEKCQNIGLCGKQIILMQGPFDEDMNATTLRYINAKFLVTKDTGDYGGFEQKVLGAKKAGVKVVVVGRPTKETGITLAQAKEKLIDLLDIKEKNHTFFPMFVNMENKNVTIVGGGKIAARRAKILLGFGAKVRVVAPEIKEEMKELSAYIEIIKGKYDKINIKDAFCVIAATNSRETNALIKEHCNKECIFVNVADVKEESDFYFSSLFSNSEVAGGLISLNGKNHATAKEYGKKINEILNKGIDK